MISDDDKATITLALKHFLKNEYHMITDFNKVIDNRQEITVDVNNETKTLYMYQCPCQTIYLDINNYPYSYDKQHIINDEYYYDFAEDADDVDTAGTYTYINTTEWQRTRETESWMWIVQYGD